MASLANPRTRPTKKENDGVAGNLAAGGRRTAVENPEENPAGGPQRPEAETDP